MAQFLRWMNELPDALVYVALWLGAGAENIVPAIPADTFVALGGFLAGVGQLDARWVALGTWVCNVAGALAVYRISHVHGPSFFRGGLGRRIMRPHQMQRVAGFYDRWGTPAIFLSRFLPGVRAIVPVFAGATHQGWVSVAVPIAAASALWYGGLVWLGMYAGRNLETLARLLDGLNRTLAMAAVVATGLALLWWLRTRRHDDD